LLVFTLNSNLPSATLYHIGCHTCA